MEIKIAIQLGLIVASKWREILITLVIVIGVIISAPIVILTILLPSAEPKLVEVYKEEAKLAGVNWVEVLVYDMVRYDNEFEEIIDKDIVDAVVDFNKVTVTRYVKVEYEQDGEIHYKWEKRGTTIYIGQEILGFIEGQLKDKEPKSFKDVLDALKKTMSILNRDPDVKYEMSRSILPLEFVIEDFEDEKKQWAMEILTSNMVYEMYGEFFDYDMHYDVGNVTFAFPTPTINVITSGFGPRNGSFHYGTDIANYGGDSKTTGAPIIASTSGEVTIARYSSSAGNWVNIATRDDKGNTIKTVYMHMQTIYVKEGDTVEQGNTIGTVGNTGDSKGAHLHFEIYINGTRVDPEKYISGGIKLRGW